ncbi:MAG: hypothetical protein JW982_06225 [Spirochaetes bacterium]|nr:hypothetical protein [Spirochaetota bacterium]
MKENTLHFTSANVDCDLYENLLKASVYYNLKSDIIFKDLIKISEKYIRQKQVLNRLTEYQDHSPEKWEILHYSLNMDEIEYYGQTRQKLKISISKLAFIGFILFWDLLMFSYKERLKISINRNFVYSYIEIKKKYLILIPYFIKRLDIIQKE